MHPALLLLAIILASLLQLSTGAINATATDSDCPPVTCGNLTITYPFSLAGRDTTPSWLLRPAGIPAHSYMRVLGINYGSRSLVAVHVLVADAAACTVIFNVSSAFEITDRFTISPSNRELYVMSKCGGTLPPPGTVPVTNFNATTTTPKFAYLGGGYGTGAPPANDGRCELAVFPVLGYRRLIRAGFRLEWKPVGDCNACRASGDRCRYDANTAAFAWLCTDGSLRTSTCDSKRKRKLTLIVSLSIVASLAFICLAWLMYRQKQKFRSGVWRSHSTVRSNEEEALRRCGSLAPQRYIYSELKKITKSFKEKLGEGGYGIVFKGSLQDGRMVAVKLLKVSKGNGEDFALVYEYMPNGSLEKYIYSELTIEWEMLLKISIGIPRGLEYLHQGCNTRIIHFDTKPHNILLDNEFCPKIADFGLAKLCHLNGSILSTAEARGTIGFIAPEVFSRAFGAVSTKSDVYSYGMMLLEMVRGKTNLKELADNSSETFFPHWLYNHLVKDIQSCRVAHGTEEIARKLTSVGLRCIQMAPENRPSMSRVIEMLERSASELEMPSKPFLYSPFQSTNASSITTVMVSMSS
uniref:Protein kinase domain-containing protein n=1 Tax=Setaria viridis TaxID=4556 RepID=A0A4V6D690_SETVI|nr:hypothetical protein SEVIR_5G092200v2 [Setaria viridis]